LSHKASGGRAKDTYWLAGSRCRLSGGGNSNTCGSIEEGEGKGTEVRIRKLHEVVIADRTARTARPGEERV